MNQVNRLVLLLVLLVLCPWLLASQPTDKIAYAMDAHSGEIRMLAAQDMKRKITVSPSRTWHVRAEGDGPTFELSFADIDQGSGVGFDDPQLGQTRVNTAVAVFDYVTTLFPQHSGTARIQFEPSITDPSFQFSGQAYPFFPGYPCTDGYQTPLVVDAIVNDEHLGELDGSIVINFGPAITWNNNHTESPAAGEMDLYSLLLHEVGHVLGFLGFAYDQTGSRIFCDNQAAFPNLARAIHNDQGEPLWSLVDGIPTFVGEDVELNAAEFAAVKIPGLELADTRLHKLRFQFQDEILQSYSGHWHPDMNRLMSNNRPFTGTRTFVFSEPTITLFNEVLGYDDGNEGSPSGITGSWFDPASDGRGFNIQFITPDRFLIYFYGYLDNGERFWLLGSFEGQVDYEAELEVSMLEGTGGVFNNYDPANVSVTPWGTLSITFSNCDTAVATLTGPDGSISFNLVKLAGVEGLSC